MAEDRIPLSCWNLTSQTRSRQSEPFQHSQRSDSTFETNHTTRIRSLNHIANLIKPASFDGPQLDSPISASTLQASDHLSEKISAHFTKIELCDDSSSTAPSFRPDILYPPQWKPSYFRVGPLIGLAALVLAFLQVFASFAILKASDGRAVSSWTLSPSVYLAVFTAMANGAISFAAVRGAVVKFWLGCLEGTTFGQLHRDWAYSFEVYKALRSGKHINVVAMACIFATLVCIDGALLQKAASSRPASRSDDISLNVSIVPEIPSYSTGSYNAESYMAEFSNSIIPVVNAYSSHAPIMSGVKGCNGSCTATIRAPALVAHHCESNSTWQNFSAPFTPEEMRIYREGSFPNSKMLFGTYLSSSFGPFETLDFETYISEDEVAQSCSGPVNATHCYLRSAIAEYKVAVNNDTITLQDAGNPKFIAWANNTAITNDTIHRFGLQVSNDAGYTKTTLGALVNAFQFQYQFNGYAYPPQHSKTPGVLDISVPIQSLFMYQQITNYPEYNNQTACTYTWNDPRPATMAGLNELMFRIGVYVAQNYGKDYLEPLLDSGVEINQTVKGTLHGTHQVFKSDFAFFFAAAALELLTILLVASTFFGYWRLGRHVSFSPLEIAKAFDAPLLKDVGCNATGRQIAKLKDAESVRYGIVYSNGKDGESPQSVGKLKMASPEEVVEPSAKRLDHQA